MDINVFPSHGMLEDGRRNASHSSLSPLISSPTVCPSVTASNLIRHAGFVSHITCISEIRLKKSNSPPPVDRGLVLGVIKHALDKESYSICELQPLIVNIVVRTLASAINVSLIINEDEI